MICVKIKLIVYNDNSKHYILDYKLIKQMKISILLIFLSIFSFSIAQKTTISGNVLDKESNNPIYGVAILIGENYLGFTDIDGSYNFSLDKKWLNEKIVFKHISYIDREISLNKLTDAYKFYLTSKTISLEEVTIAGNIEKKPISDIIKKSTKKFENIYANHPYWSGLNHKQLIYLDGMPQSYLEFDGHILMVGRSNNNPFIDACIVPSEIRRTKESERLVKSWFSNSDSKNFSKTQLGHGEAMSGWTDFRFVEIIHPLSKKGRKHFNYSMSGLTNENEKFLIINFNQKKGITVGTRWLDNMFGQFWINKTDLSLHRLVTSYRFERIFLISYDITYTSIENKIFPFSVKKSIYNFKSSNDPPSNITISSISYFNKINTKRRDNHRKKYRNSWYSISHKYNHAYWSNKSIKEDKFRNGLSEILNSKPFSEVFDEGANTKEYNSNISEDIFSLWEQSGLKLKEQMLKDLKD